MQDFKLDSIERMKDINCRIERVLKTQSEMIENNVYNPKKYKELNIRNIELILEVTEALKKLPAEVIQLTREFMEKNRQIHRADVELIEINNKLYKEIKSTNKINKRLTTICGLLLGLLIASVITIIILKT